MAKSDVTVLHLSDPQFGRHHIFGDAGLSRADGHFDSLRTRLVDDLGKLREEEQVAPDLVVVSGDIAEWALPEEFQEAEECFRSLMSELELPLDALMVVPGNHDINRNLCEGYFLTCKGRGIEPTEPFAAKWEHFFDFYGRLFGEGALSDDEPWALRTVAGTQVVVACLNSTMRESHRDEDHYGWIGEDQLRWFKERLSDYDEDWWRIAVVHHNVQRGAQLDDENLRDAEDFEALLGESVDLVLHGHTHNGRVGRWGNGVPIVSTGSAAVAATARPIEVPNQYQVLRLSHGAIELLGRRYEPDKKRWGGDTRITPSGADWRTTVPARLAEPNTTQEVDAAGTVLADDTTYAEVELDEAELLRHIADLRQEAAAMLPPGATPRDYVQSFGLAPGGDVKRAAIVMFTALPVTNVPSAMIQCVRYRGIDRTAARDSHQETGPARRQLENALEFVRERVGKRERPAPGEVRSSVSYDLPMTAVRECLANAVVHRDYDDESRHIHVRLFDDRLEIASPGEWVGRDLGEAEIPVADLISQSVKRNPDLALYFSQVRAFEGEGSGLPVAVEESAAMFAPPPTVRCEDGFCVVTIRPAPLDADVVERYVAAQRRFVDFGVGLEPGLSSRSERQLIEPRLRVPGGRVVRWQALLEVEAAEEPILITGPPGSGKTTLVYLLLGEALERSTDPGGPGLPVFVRAADLGVSARSDDESWIAGGMARAQLQELAPSEASAVAQAALTSQRGLIIVDGLDEIVDRRAVTDVLRRLERMAAEYSDVRFVVTSRPVSLLGAPSWIVYEMEPLSESDVQRLLIEYGNEGRLRSLGEFRSLLEANPQLGDLAANPLLLSLLVDAFDERASVPFSRAALLSQALRSLVSTWDRRRSIQRTSLAPAEVEQLLGDIAVAVLDSGSPPDNVPGDLLDNVLLTRYPAMSRQFGDSAFVDTFLAAAGGVIVPAEAYGSYRFAHRVFFDYLVASTLVRDRSASVDQFGLLRRVPEAAALYFELSAEFDHGLAMSQFLDDAARRGTGESAGFISQALASIDTRPGSPVRDGLERWLAVTDSESLFAQELTSFLGLG